MKDSPASNTKEERERAKPNKTTERSVDDVARQLYPIKPIPVKKAEDRVKQAKEPKQTAPSTITKTEKAPGTDKVRCMYISSCR